MFPKYPSDDQEISDIFGSIWKWNSTYKYWFKLDAIPDGVTTQDQAGLLSKEFKSILDVMPPHGGGFGFVTENASMLSSHNGGVVTGNVRLLSSTLEIGAYSVNGDLISPDAIQLESGDDHIADIKVKCSQTLLDNLCFELYTPMGPPGIRGERGAKGRDGHNNSPKGLRGVKGNDAIDVFELTSIEVVDDPGVTNHGLVAIEVDSDSGELLTTYGDVYSSNPDVPADHISASSLSRSIGFRASRGDCAITLDDWFLQSPSFDPLNGDSDLLVGIVPDTAEAGDVIDLNFQPLRNFIQLYIDYFKNKLNDFDRQWLNQMRDHMSGIDEAARQAIGSLADELSRCEFERPLDYAVGIDQTIVAPPSGGPILNPGIPVSFLSVISIIDESSPYNSSSNGANNYGRDYDLWVQFITAIRTSGAANVRGCVYTPGSGNTAPEISAIMCETCTLPPEPYRTTIDRYSTPSNQWLTSVRDTSRPRVSPIEILNAFDLMTGGGANVPFALTFTIDDSGSMGYPRDYLPASSTEYGDTLIEAKDLIKAKYPSITIYPDVDSGNREEWLRDMLVACLLTIEQNGGIPGVTLPFTAEQVQRGEV